MNFWYSAVPGLRARMLWPFSLVFNWVTQKRRSQRNCTAYAKPVIVVGNLSVGGTGKTPTLLWLIRTMQQAGLRPAVISRGYKAKPNRAFPVLIESSFSATEAGDEPLLIKRRTGVPVIIDPLRHRAANFVCQQLADQVDVILSDDGLQHYPLFRDLEIAMVDPLRGFGNGCIIPAGPLREPLSRLTQCDWVLAKAQPEASELVVSEAAEAHYGAVKNAVGEVLVVCSVRLMSGIGNFESFRRSVQQLGYQIIDEAVFADHEEIPASALADTSYPILVTEKDFVKLSQPSPHIYYLPYDLSYSAELAKRIASKVQELIHEKSSHHSRAL